MNKNFKALILAAGRGVRMNSELPKVMHSICGKPMLKFVLEAVEPLKIKDLIVVAGFKPGLILSLIHI